MEEQLPNLEGVAQLQVGAASTRAELRFAAFAVPRGVCRVFWDLLGLYRGLGVPRTLTTGASQWAPTWVVVVIVDKSR